MAINVDREQDIIKSFKKCKMLANILPYVAGAGLGLTVYSWRYHGETVTGLSRTFEVILGLLITVAALIGDFFAWHCPACKKFMGFNTKIKACPKCNTIFLGGDTRGENHGNGG